MRTFKQYLLEAEVNFDTSDVSPQAKKAGRAIIAKIAEISAQTLKKMESFIGKKATSPEQVMKVFNSFCEAFPKEARIISTNRGQQVGPGEMVFYFIFDNIGVGGNQNIDLFLNGKPFAEVKSGNVMVRRGKQCIEKFELSPGNHPAVRKIMKDMKAFNEAYKDENDGNDLPGWKSEDDVNIEPLLKWRDLTVSGDGGVDLTLKQSGDLMKKGEDDPVLNVNKAKTISPLKKLLDEPVETSDVNKAIKDWAEAIGDSYVKDKLFFLLDNNKLKCMYAGEISADKLDLMAIWRGRPIARVYPKGKPKGSSTETKE